MTVVPARDFESDHDGAYRRNDWSCAAMAVGSQRIVTSLTALRTTRSVAKPLQDAVVLHSAFRNNGPPPGPPPGPRRNRNGQQQSGWPRDSIERRLRGAYEVGLAEGGGHDRGSPFLAVYSTSTTKRSVNTERV